MHFLYNLVQSRAALTSNAHFSQDLYAYVDHLQMQRMTLGHNNIIINLNVNWFNAPGHVLPFYNRMKYNIT